MKYKYIIYYITDVYEEMTNLETEFWDVLVSETPKSRLIKPESNILSIEWVNSSDKDIKCPDTFHLTWDKRKNLKPLTKEKFEAIMFLELL